jgi:hypothetical protein
MTRKGKLSVVTQNYPYVVKVVVPRGAWRDLDNMHEFHVRNGIARLGTPGLEPGSFFDRNTGFFFDRNSCV